jgi:hypothetical protein
MLRGISQRKLASLLGLTAHSNTGDYERGRRVAPLDIVVAWERVLALPEHSLRQWYESALEERADRWFADRLARSAE